MRSLILTLSLIFGLEQGESCVKYSPSTGTYTVDPNGSVKKKEKMNHFQYLKHKKHKKSSKFRRCLEK